MKNKKIPSWLEGQILESPSERNERLEKERKKRPPYEVEISKEELAKRLEGFDEFASEFLQKMAEIKAGK